MKVELTKEDILDILTALDFYGEAGRVHIKMLALYEAYKGFENEVS